jgi:predicted  nucleic acid-binding Zn-ribbon protein
MTIAKRFYELQRIDLEIDEINTVLDSVVREIDDRSKVFEAELELNSVKDHLKDIEKKRRDLEYEVEDLQKNISELNGKLFGGKVKNPKELLSMEQEKNIFQASLNKKEDSLLDLMEDEESTNKDLQQQKVLLKKVETEWQQEQKALHVKKAELDHRLNELNRKRQELINGVELQSLQIYDMVRTRKGNAVAEVEQGRCQGCHIKLSMNEWQKARTGVLVQCSSCGRILYLS